MCVGRDERTWKVFEQAVPGLLIRRVGPDQVSPVGLPGRPLLALIDPSRHAEPFHQPVKILARFHGVAVSPQHFM